MLKDLLPTDHCITIQRAFSVRIPKRVQTATAHAHLLFRLYLGYTSVHIGQSMRGTTMPLTSKPRGTTNTSMIPHCVQISLSRLHYLWHLPPGSDTVSPAPLARGGQVDRISVESRAAAVAVAAVAVTDRQQHSRGQPGYGPDLAFSYFAG